MNSLTDFVKEFVAEEKAEIAEQLKINMQTAIKNKPLPSGGEFKAANRQGVRPRTGRLANAVEIELVDEELTVIGINASKLGKFDYSEIFLLGRPGGKKKK